MLTRFSASLFAVTIMLSLSACGGGSDTPEDTPPVIITPPSLEPGQVATTEGTYQGETVGDLLVFKGIAYAAPPSGALRFKAPEAAASFTGVRNALDFGSDCAQPQGTSTVGSEDCLFLNIWGHDDDTVRPVMVYMHPGAAGGDLGSINAEELANDVDVVVVNLNRRIGILGYLAIDELIAENPQMTAGNYGLLDSIEALKWVQNNIGEFNGDPNHVMLFGTSSGGILSCVMLGAPEVTGLVQAVAIQSAPCGGRPLQVLNAASPHTSSNPPVTDTHRSILPATGCDVAADILACLRGLSADELIQASAAAELAVPHALYGAIVDGVVVEHPPRTALLNQTIGDVALIVGMTNNEFGSRFDNLDIPDDATYEAVLSNIFGSPVDNALYTLWPAFDPATASYVEFGDTVSGSTNHRGGRCAAMRAAL